LGVLKGESMPVTSIPADIPSLGEDSGITSVTTRRLRKIRRIADG